MNNTKLLCINICQIIYLIRKYFKLLMGYDLILKWSLINFPYIKLITRVHKTIPKVTKFNYLKILIVLYHVFEKYFKFLKTCIEFIFISHNSSVPETTSITVPKYYSVLYFIIVIYKFMFLHQ